MPEVYIHHAGACVLGCEDGPEINDLKAAVSRSARRRMTRTALMIHHSLGDIDLSKFDTIVYQTAYSEVQTVEKYIDGFPHPSPLQFQVSIHPSGAEQVLIDRKCSVRQFYPLADLGAPLPALRCLSRLGGEGLLIFAEEEGSWLAEKGLASESSFAASLSVSPLRDGAIGRIHWRDRFGCPSEEDTFSFVQAIRKRRPLSLRSDRFELNLEWF